MLNKLVAFSKEHDLWQKGDKIVCAVSGGADSMALLWSMYLIKDRYNLDLSAAHFNHGLRGEESDRDAQFVKTFCDRFGIPLFMHKGAVVAGKKGLEAAARDARYAFFQSLSGKIATAHTANDNAETVLMHIVRGSGLKGLGGIAPKRGNLIRPMLSLTRNEVVSFLEEYHIDYITDSSNYKDDFLRNRLRHHVMPLLEKENPKFAVNTSAMSMRLRQDEETLSCLTQKTDQVSVLRRMDPSLRYRAISSLLEDFHVKEPSSEHIALIESIVFSSNPSACISLPNGITVARNYDVLERRGYISQIPETELTAPGEVIAGDVRIICESASNKSINTECFTVLPVGRVVVRSRQPGDLMRLMGGTKKLKELFIDRKIPADSRKCIPVIADDIGVLGVYGFGANLDRISDSGIQICFEKI